MSAYRQPPDASVSVRVWQKAEELGVVSKTKIRERRSEDDADVVVGRTEEWGLNAVEDLNRLCR